MTINIALVQQSTVITHETIGPHERGKFAGQVTIKLRESCARFATPSLDTDLACVLPFFFLTHTHLQINMATSSAASSVSCNLRLLLFGASGRTGQLLVDEALQRGHCVTAFVRNPSKLNELEAKLTQDKKERFRLAGGSVMNGGEVENVIRNGFEGKPFDAVLSTLTSDEKPHTTCSESTTHVLSPL